LLKKVEELLILEKVFGIILEHILFI